MKHQNIFNRLRRIEGQVRGIEDMVAKERSEAEILIQLEAVESSVSSTIASLIESMLESDGENIQLKKSDIAAIMRNIRK